MRLEDLKDGEITTMANIVDACGIEFGDTTALVQRGHHPPWALRHEALWEHDVEAWPRRVYMRSMPWSLLHPDEPPCQSGEEPIVWERCKRDTPGAIPMMILELQ